MPAPALSKSPQFATSVAKATTGNAANDHKQNLLALKTILIGFATLGWVPRCSSNGSVANTSDNWSTIADILGAAAGSAHSWIVLRQTGMGPTFDICLDVTAAGFTSSMAWYCSPGGYQTTGLSVSNRPATTVASDEVQIVGVNNIVAGWISSGGGTFSSFVSGMQSTDGQYTRLFILGATGSVLASFWFEKIQNPAAGLAFPFNVGYTGNAADDLLYASLGATAQASNPSTVTTPRSRGRFNASTQMRLSWASEGYGTSTQYLGQRQTVANDLSGAFPMAPIQIEADTLSPVISHGKLGTLADVYFGSTGVTSGDTYATKAWIQLNNIIWPWDGSIPLGPVGSTDRTGELIPGLSDSVPIYGGHPVALRAGGFRGFGGSIPPRNQVI